MCEPKAELAMMEEDVVDDDARAMDKDDDIVAGTVMGRMRWMEWIS
jgi:hypothetical protein